jgi:hypothetical protein
LSTQTGRFSAIPPVGVVVGVGAAVVAVAVAVGLVPIDTNGVSVLVGTPLGDSVAGTGAGVVVSPEPGSVTSGAAVVADGFGVGVGVAARAGPPRPTSATPVAQARASRVVRDRMNVVPFAGQSAGLPSATKTPVASM